MRYYKTEKGLLVNKPKGNWRVNSINPKETFNKEWCLIENADIPLCYEVQLPNKQVNIRYELNLPKVVDEVPEGLERVYSLRSDWKSQGYKEEKMTFELIGTLSFSNLGDPSRFSYRLEDTQAGWGQLRSETLTYENLINDWKQYISVDDITKAMCAPIGWHLQPCSISGDTAYRLIRAYVKDHIDPKEAEITSDYDFCFTVKKKVKTKPYIVRREFFTSRGKSYRPPKYKETAYDVSLREIFEMTPPSSKYSGYTWMRKFEGACLEDLAEHIDLYLKELMRRINEPLAYCEGCGGTGVIFLSQNGGTK